MKTKSIWVLVSVLVVLGLLIGGFGCAAPAPEVTPTPTPAKPTPTPAKPTPAKPTPTPAPAPAAPDVIKWKGQLAVAPGPPIYHFETTGYATPPHAWSDWLNEATGGRLEIEWVHGAAIVPVAEQLASVGKGVLPVTLNWGTWSSGIQPEGNIETGIPFIAETGAEAFDWMYNTGIYELFLEAYAEHNTYPLIYGQGSIQGMGASFPLDGPDSIKGHNIRGMGVQADYVTLLGGAPVSVPWAELYMALKLGTVDGFVGGISGLTENKFSEVTTHYVIEPHLSNCSITLVINKDELAALPDDIREMITRDSKYFLHTICMNMTMAEKHTIANLKDVIFQKWSEEDAVAVRQKAAAQMWPKLASPNARCAEIMALTEAWAKAYGKL